MLGLEQSQWVPQVRLSLFVVSVFQFSVYCSTAVVSKWLELAGGICFYTMLIVFERKEGVVTLLYVKMLLTSRHVRLKLRA